MTYHRSMPGAVLLDPTRIWECPLCGARHKTVDPKVRGRAHPCPNLGGINVPMQPATRYGIDGETHHVKVIERGDWIGTERVQHGGVMAVQAHRSDGSHDTRVFAPTAHNKHPET